MDPIIQGALTMVVGGLLCGIAARIFVPLLPPSPPENEDEAPRPHSTAAE